MTQRSPRVHGPDSPLGRAIAALCYSQFEGCCCSEPKGHPGPHHCDVAHADGRNTISWSDADAEAWELELSIKYDEWRGR